MNNITFFSDRFGQNHPLLHSGTPDMHNKLSKKSNSFNETIEHLLSNQKHSLAFVFSSNTLSEFKSFMAVADEYKIKEIAIGFAVRSIYRDSFAILKKYLQNRIDIKIIASKDDSVLLGLVFERPITPPTRAVIEICNRCNLKCDFCWSHSPLNKEPRWEKWHQQILDKKIIFKYIDELVQSQVSLVELCAIGDPLFHPDAWEIIDYIKSNNLKIRISTNATLITPERVDHMIKIGVDEIFMNISSGDRDTYAPIHNVSPVVFDNLTVALRYLRQEKKRLGITHPYTRVINIITAKNISTIGEIINYIVELDFNYADFRKVWIHNEFLRELGIENSNPSHPNLLGLSTKLSGIENNFVDFINDIGKH